MAKPKAAQDFVPIQEIRNGVVILKNKSMRAVLMASSINFALKSQDEQNAIIAQFQNLLNTLDFPMQILVQSRDRDIRPYIALLEERLAAQTDDLMRIQITEYIAFIKTFVESANVMTKNFFVVVPYTPATVTTVAAEGQLKKMLQKVGVGGERTQQQHPETVKREQFEEQRSQLNQRLALVAQGLSGVGIRTVQLGTEELVELYYKMFNPGELTKPIAGKQQPVANAQQ